MKRRGVVQNLFNFSNKPNQKIMRRIFLSAVVITTCLVACNDTKTGSASKTDDASQKNIEASKRIADAFQTGNTAAIDSFVADDFIDHTDRGDKIGKDSLKAMINMVHSTMKDMKAENLSVTAENDHVFHWIKFTGTSDGSMGMPAGPYTMHTMEVSRFKDGKAVEHWAYMETQEMMKMMASMGQQMPHDTTMKR
jgi:predicted SnoaL-like aldol condensation-catalyzing enzyme